MGNSAEVAIPHAVKAHSSTTTTVPKAADTGPAVEQRNGRKADAAAEQSLSMATDVFKNSNPEIPISRSQADASPSASSVLPSPISTESAQALDLHEKLKVLTSTMGFEQQQALAALEAHGGDVKRAAVGQPSAPLCSCSLYSRFIRSLLSLLVAV